MNAKLVALAIPAFLALAGCASQEASPADLRMTPRWQPWQGDNYPHLVLSFTNYGGQPALVGPGGREVTVTGPAGNVPLDWGETSFAREMLGGMSVSVGFHPRSMNNGTFVLAIDHDHPRPMDPPRGTYTVCLEHDCSRADLG